MRKSMDEKDEGFTLIELLVVIIIIGILAAIAIPVFLNQRKKAVDASIKSDLRTVANEEETYYTDAQQYATNTGTSAIPIIGTSGSTVKMSPNNVLTGITLNTANTAYCIQITDPKGTDTTNGLIYVSNAGGLQVKGTVQATVCGTAFMSS
jgi:type IV pilus assembly protein PilA